MSQYEDEDYADLGAWRTSRPTHEPPHDRFFEDGEEPPERYDLPDGIDYIEVNPDRIRSGRWYRIAWKVTWLGSMSVIAHSFGYHVICSVTFCLVGPLLQLLLGPSFHADITIHWLARLTGNGRRFKTPASAYGKTMRFALGNLAVQLSAFVTIFVLIELGAGLYEGIDVVYASHQSDQSYPSIMRLVLPLFVLGITGMVLLHGFIAVRICGFVTHLILDHELELIEAMRANWRITRGRTWQLMRVKIALWAIKYPFGLVTLGLGLIFLEPYCVAVWTAAYLDIAGAEPILENVERLAKT
jgi:hypothetical protein